MEYVCVATSVEGFVQQLAVAYVTHGYCFCVRGERSFVWGRSAQSWTRTAPAPSCYAGSKPCDSKRRVRQFSLTTRTICSGTPSGTST